jgi:ribulose-5-phosphate 4-epimerase/fuculose-1-phosphate aldolase
METDPSQSDDAEMCPELFVDLLSQFYRLGWVMGSSGGMACVSRAYGNDLTLYSPSSVQKERLRPLAHLFSFIISQN